QFSLRQLFLIIACVSVFLAIYLRWSAIYGTVGALMVVVIAVLISVVGYGAFTDTGNFKYLFRLLAVCVVLLFCLVTIFPFWVNPDLKLLASEIKSERDASANLQLTINSEPRFSELSYSVQRNPKLYWFEVKGTLMSESDFLDFRKKIGKDTFYIEWDITLKNGKKISGSDRAIVKEDKD
ncbi:MAG: hypothetical protein ABL888_20045, partial [Pirellulaceae bacterium]